MKILRVFLFSVLLCSSVINSAPAIWDGTADVSWYEESAQAYNLVTAEQLAGLAKLVNEGTSDFSGKTITLGANIFLNDTSGAGDGSWYNKPHQNWTPIGNKDHLFSGTFDGLAGNENCKIYGLYIKNDSTDNVGFFGKVSAKIRNVDILVGRVSAKDNVGALVGNGGSVSNVHIEACVSGNNFVGGIAGYFPSKIENTHFVGNVFGTGGDIGGIVGLGSSQILLNDSFTGDVKGFDRVGGLCGSLCIKIQNSYAEGSVKGNEAVGGLMGSYSNIYEYPNVAFDVKVLESQFIGSVIGSGDYVGGLIGLAGNVNILNSETFSHVGGRDFVGGLIGKGGKSAGTVKIENSHANGNVNGGGYIGGVVGSITFDEMSVSIISSSHKAGDVTGSSDNVGGVVGDISGKMLNSVYIDSSFHINGDVAGKNNVGGLAGSVDRVSAITNHSCTIKNSYTEGSVVGEGNFIGGVIGYGSGITVLDSLNHRKGDVSGASYVGGIAGAFRGGKISNSWSEANVEGAGTVGGSIGYTSAYVNSVYHIGDYVVGLLSVGGLVGIMDETNRNCGVRNSHANIGFVKGTNVGGLVSYIRCDSLVNSYFIGDSIDSNPAYSPAIVYSDNLNGRRGNRFFLGAGGYYIGNWDNRIEVATESLEGMLYDGEEKRPSVISATLFGKELIPEIDYTVNYENNVNAGTASIHVCLMDETKSCKVIEFKIKKIEVEPKIGHIEDVIYTGAPLTPEVSVFLDGKKIADTNYVVQYKDNEYVGTASVSVTMKGNYSGSATTAFSIRKAVPKIYSLPFSRCILGDKLERCVMNGGFADVEGIFSWENPAKHIDFDEKMYAAKFSPSDTLNYTGPIDLFVPVECLVYVVVYSEGKVIDSLAVARGFTYTMSSNVFSEISKRYNEGYDYVGLYNGDEKIPRINGTSSVQVNDNTVLVMKYTLVTYEITFMMGNEVVQKAEFVQLTTPTAPSVVLPENTSQYTYTFVGWQPAIHRVVFDETYYAVIDSVINQYDIVFENYDGTILKTDTYYYGTPVYQIAKPDDPIRQTTPEFYYEFKGWSPAVESVSGPTTYVAMFDSVRNYYTIIFKNGTTVLQQRAFEYGMNPVLYDWDPVKEMSNEYSYSFAGWTPDIEPVTGPAIYTALFDSTLRSFAITFQNDSLILQSNSVVYGEKPIYRGVVPTRASTAQYTYSFVGWNPEIDMATDSATYRAVFDSVLNDYVVTFQNAFSILQSSSFVYGEMPSYNGEVPTKPSTAQYNYQFAGWDPAVKNVTNAATYTAVFDSALNKYTVTFVNGSEKLQSSEVIYGEMPKYEGKEPSRKETADFTYSFVKWSPVAEPVTKNVVYEAIFDSTEIVKSSSSVKPESSSSENNEISSSSEPNSLIMAGLPLQFHISVFDRNIQIAGSRIGAAYALFDMQGRVLHKGLVSEANFNLPVPASGNYLIRVGSQIQKVNVK